MNKKVIYSELAKTKITDSRNVVISSCPQGFTIAQQLEVAEENKTMTVFLKGAFHINNVEGLVNLRDAINLAIKTFNENVEVEQSYNWDEK